MHEELEKLDDLYNPFVVVYDFISSLHRGNWEKKGTQWVYDPNFVTFSIHYQRAHNVTVCLRGNPHEFIPFGHLPLKPAQSGYSRCKVESVNQLDALLCYIRRAYEIWTEGRTRAQKEIVILKR